MTSNFSMTAGQAVARAYRILGNLEPPYVPSDDQMTQGLLAANMILKGWVADGINLFRQGQRTITVPAMAQSVAITPYVAGIEQASWVVQGSPNTYKRPMGAFTYVDYWNLPNPQSNTTSGPSVYMFDKQDQTSTLWLWPVPTLGGTIIASVGRYFNDVSDAASSLDFPDEWTEAFVYNLADRLMDDQGTASADPATAQRIALHAAILQRKLLDFDRPTSVMLRPWGRRGTGPFWR